MVKKPKTPVAVEAPAEAAPVRCVQATLDTCATLDASKVQFHKYTGQMTALRKWAKDIYSLDFVAERTDAELAAHILQQGWVPVVINGDSREYGETIYLIRRELLAQAAPLYR